MILVYVTFPDAVQAKRISEILLQKKLVACAVQMPVQSSYWWQGEIAEDDEIVVLFKSRADLQPQIEKAIEAEHPYDVPCIITMQAQANAAYLDWINQETAQ